MKKLLYVLIYLILFLCYGKLYSQENSYIIVSDSSEDSLFCTQYCPFYDFDSKENIIGMTLPEQMVSLPENNMIQLLEAMQIVLESTFGYNPQGLPFVLYVVVDNTGIVRGVIVDTENHQSKRSENTARVAFDYLKTKEFIPASLRGKPITYGFYVFAKINEENKVNNEIGVATEPTSWPVYQNNQYYQELNDFVKDNLHYEDTITIAQTVRVRFIVDTLGNTHHHEIVHSESPALNDEALRICRLIRFAKPAMQRDRPVSVWFHVPVKFEPKVVKPKQKHCIFKRRK
jgi:TonB family protein